MNNSKIVLFANPNTTSFDDESTISFYGGDYSPGIGTPPFETDSFCDTIDIINGTIIYISKR